MSICQWCFCSNFLYLFAFLSLPPSAPLCSSTSLHFSMSLGVHERPLGLDPHSTTQHLRDIEEPFCVSVVLSVKQGHLIPVLQIPGERLFGKARSPCSTDRNWSLIRHEGPKGGVRWPWGFQHQETKQIPLTRREIEKAPNGLYDEIISTSLCSSHCIHLKWSPFSLTIQNQQVPAWSLQEEVSASSKLLQHLSHLHQHFSCPACGHCYLRRRPNFLSEAAGWGQRGPCLLILVVLCFPTVVCLENLHVVQKYFLIYWLHFP